MGYRTFSTNNRQVLRLRASALEAKLPRVVVKRSNQHERCGFNGTHCRDEARYTFTKMREGEILSAKRYCFHHLEDMLRDSYRRGYKVESRNTKVLELLYTKIV